MVVVKETALERARRLGDTELATRAEQGRDLAQTMQHTDAAHQHTKQVVLEHLAQVGAKVRVVRVGRRFSLEGVDLVITVGGDGTFLWASHLLDTTPVLGINSAPRTSTGFFCAASADTFVPVFERILSDALEPSCITRMRVLRGAEVLCDRVLNEVLVAAASPAAVTRLSIRAAEVASATRFQCSGLWVGPPAGSSAAMASAGGQHLPLSSAALQWVVREPSGGPQPLSRGILPPKHPLWARVESRDVRLFVDGGRRPVGLHFGDELLFDRSAHPLYAWTPGILAARPQLR